MARRCFLFSVPITLIFADRTLPVYKEVTNWLAKQLNIEPVSVLGRHGFYYYRPEVLADVLRRTLKQSRVRAHPVSRAGN